MGLTISTDILYIIGIAYSSIGIALGFFQCFVRKTHSRALDYVQWGYFLAIANTAVTIPFSPYLSIGSSLVPLSSDSLSLFYCPMDNYVCLRPFALSFLVILVGVLVILRLITIPQKVRQKGFTFPRVYRFFKGLLKWFYLPLVYLSFLTLISGTTNFIPAAVVLAALLVFPIVQVILYKFFDPEDEDPFVKWLQFANYLKAALFALLVVLATVNSASMYYYYLAAVLIAYAGFFAYKYNFRYEVAGRVMYLFGQIVFYFLYSLYVSSSAMLVNYYLDLFALGIILVIDIIYLIMQTVPIVKQFKNSNAQVVPQQSSGNIQTNRKKNRYEVQQGADLPKVDSKDNLNDSRGSSNGGLLNNSSSIKKNGKDNPRPRPSGK